MYISKTNCIYICKKSSQPSDEEKEINGSIDTTGGRTTGSPRHRTVVGSLKCR